MAKTKKPTLKSMPYWCRNHYIDYAYKLCGDWYISINSVIARDIVEKAPFKFRKGAKITEVYMTDKEIIKTTEKFSLAKDLVPVLDKTLTTLNPLVYQHELGGGVDINQLIWELTVLPPAPGWKVFPNTFKKKDGLAVMLIAPIPLGWILYRLQDIDGGLEWEVSYIQRALYLKTEGEIKAILLACSWSDSLEDEELWTDEIRR